MKHELQKAFTQVTSTLKETLTDLTDSAKEKTIAIIESWLEVFPELESLGLEMTSFGLTLALSPSLDVELSGPAGLFDKGRLDEYRKRYKDNSHVSTVLRAIHTSKQLYHKLGKQHSDEIFLKISVKVPPEVSVYFGKPAIL
jgi:hypothetical protein